MRFKYLYYLCIKYDTMDNLYEVLGITNTATKEQIKKAYKKKAMEHHPDKGGDEETFKKVAQAYDILSDDTKKNRYDTTGSIDDQPNGGSPFGGNDFFDFMDAMFGGGGKKRTPKGESIHIQFNVDLHEFFTGFTKPITYNKAMVCEPCNATGGKSGVCSTCKGQGRVSVNRGSINMVTTCSVCHGHGKIIIEPCVKCDGNGYKMVETELDIEIPPCTFSSIQYTGLGHQVINGDDGDLIISLQVVDLCGFQINGVNLLKTVEVPYYDLMLGCVIEVDSVDQTKIKVTIPKNTKPEAKLRVKSRGLLYSDSVERGDMIINLKPSFPDEISDEDEKLLNELKKNRE